MDVQRSSADGLLDVVRVRLLVQGAILVVTTIEALIFGAAFAGAAGPSLYLSAASAATLLFARVRLRADRRWIRRLVYVVEGVILITLALDAALAILITGAVPPLVALLTGFVLPLAVIGLLRRSSRPSATDQSTTVASLEVTL